jgi:uncharacterized membrane protein
MSRSARRAPIGAIVEKRPIYVTTLYALGIVGAAVLVFSALFTIGGYFSSDDTVVAVSLWALLVWGGLVVLAAVTWLLRRKGQL